MASRTHHRHADYPHGLRNRHPRHRGSTKNGRPSTNPDSSLSPSVMLRSSRTPSTFSVATRLCSTAPSHATSNFCMTFRTAARQQRSRRKPDPGQVCFGDSQTFHSNTSRAKRTRRERICLRNQCKHPANGIAEGRVVSVNPPVRAPAMVFDNSNNGSEREVCPQPRVDTIRQISTLSPFPVELAR